MAWVKKVFRRRFSRFWRIIDSDNIIVNQMLFYILISLHGLFSLIYGVTGSQVMEQATSRGYYVFWMWLCFAAPLTTIVAKLMRGNWTYTGLWLQVVGDLGTFMIFVCYIGAIINTSAWASGSFAGTLALCCALGTPLFVARDLRRIAQVERKVIRDERSCR